MSGYILRHKLKNPAYASDSNHQWFNIVDIFNNGTKNEIHLHGILKDKDSVSTDNIEDHAVTAIKTNFLIFGSNEEINESLVPVEDADNYLTIYPKSISSADLTDATVRRFTQVSGSSVDTAQIVDNAVITAKIRNEAVTAEKLDPNINWNNQFTDNTISGDKLTDGSISGEKLNTKLLGAIISTAEDLNYMFDPTQAVALSDWDQNHLGIWIKI